MAATSAESTSDPAAGSSTCWNWDMGPPGWTVRMWLR